MTDPQSGISALITGGLGAAVGGIITAVVQVVSKRGESRAAAAELVTRAAGSMIDRLQAENDDLRSVISDILDAQPDSLRNLRDSRGHRAVLASLNIRRKSDDDATG